MKLAKAAVSRIGGTPPESAAEKSSASNDSISLPQQLLRAGVYLCLFAEIESRHDSAAPVSIGEIVALVGAAERVETVQQVLSIEHGVPSIQG